MQAPADSATTSTASPSASDAEHTTVHPSHTLTHLKQLEAESIHVMREVVASFSNPCMLFSVGKDSCVMLHLARKAFAPGKPPFPLVHVDTTWNFQSMYDFRDNYIVGELGMEVIVHINEEGVKQGISPFTHGSKKYTDIMNLGALKQALDKYQFDAAFGGGRRDEEKSRAKERVFSFRDSNHRWDPKNQRPELWHLYNTEVDKGEQIRVFPLSNWTELDIWQYIYLENIPIVDVYYSAERPVVNYEGQLILVDDAAACPRSSPTPRRTSGSASAPSAATPSPVPRKAKPPSCRTSSRRCSSPRDRNAKAASSTPTSGASMEGAGEHNPSGGLLLVLLSLLTSASAGSSRFAIH